jgi:hypothetical protein
MGISGFDPVFLTGIGAIRGEHGARLAALAGRCLTGHALVRFVEDGEWFADCPVVLDFDGVQVELCHWKLDEVSIGWNTIDTSAAITGWDGLELTPRWSFADDQIGRFAGQELCGAALLEWRSPGHDLANGSVAVEFTFGAGRFHVANGLDENSIGEDVSGFVRHMLGRNACP